MAANTVTWLIVLFAGTGDVLCCVQNGSLIWSNEVKDDVDRHLSSVLCCCCQQHQSPYVVTCSRHHSCLSLHFNGHFPGGPGLAGTRMSPFWILLELRMMEVVSADNWNYKMCKAPVRSSPPTNQHPVFLQARCPSCRTTSSVRALKGQVCNAELCDEFVRVK